MARSGSVDPQVELPFVSRGRMTRDPPLCFSLSQRRGGYRETELLQEASSRKMKVLVICSVPGTVSDAGCSEVPGTRLSPANPAVI